MQACMHAFHIWYDSTITAYLDQVSGHVNKDFTSYTMGQEVLDS